MSTAFKSLLFSGFHFDVIGYLPTLGCRPRQSRTSLCSPNVWTYSLLQKSPFKKIYTKVKRKHPRSAKRTDKTGRNHNSLSQKCTHNLEKHFVLLCTVPQIYLIILISIVGFVNSRLYSWTMFYKLYILEKPDIVSFYLVSSKEP